MVGFERALEVALNVTQDFHEKHKEITGIDALSKIVFQEILKFELTRDWMGENERD